MEFLGSVNIFDHRPQDTVKADVGDALGVELAADGSGFYEELPAYVARVLGLEIALLRIGSPGEDGAQFQVLVRGIAETSGQDEVDVSRHLADLLSAHGLRCAVDAP
jgi:hypothetical protein